MRKTLRNLVVAGSILASSLGFADRVVVRTEQEVYDAVNNPQVTEIVLDAPRFDNLDFEVVGKRLEGRSVVVPESILDFSTTSSLSNANDGTVLYNPNITLNGNSTFSFFHVVDDRETSDKFNINIKGKDNNVLDNYFSGNGWGDALRTNASSTINILGNVFTDYMIPTRVGKQSDAPVVRENTFANSRYGIWSQNPEKLDLGNKTEYGNNIFIQNERGNMKLIYDGNTHEAVGNWWYALGNPTTMRSGSKGIERTLLTDEESIRQSLFISNPNKSNSRSQEINLYPFHTKHPFSTNTRFNETQTASVQSDGNYQFGVWNYSDNDWQVLENASGDRTFSYNMPKGEWLGQFIYDNQSARWQEAKYELNEGLGE